MTRRGGGAVGVGKSPPPISLSCRLTLAASLVAPVSPGATRSKRDASFTGSLSPVNSFAPMEPAGVEPATNPSCRAGANHGVQSSRVYHSATVPHPVSRHGEGRPGFHRLPHTFLSPTKGDCNNPIHTDKGIEGKGLEPLIGVPKTPVLPLHHPSLYIVLILLNIFFFAPDQNRTGTAC